jgi:hypothetical protein
LKCVTLRNRSRSIILDFVKDPIGVHLWMKFDQPRSNIFEVTLMTSWVSEISRNCPLTLRNRSRSIILDILNGHIGRHVWLNFDQPGSNILGVMLITSWVGETLWNCPVTLRNRSRSIILDIPNGHIGIQFLDEVWSAWVKYIWSYVDDKLSGWNPWKLPCDLEK